MQNDANHWLLVCQTKNASDKHNAHHLTLVEMKKKSKSNRKEKKKAKKKLIELNKMDCPIAIVNFFLLLLLDVRFICAIFGVEMFVCEPEGWTNNCEMPLMKCALLSFYYRFCSLVWCSIVHFTSNNTFCILFEVLLCTSECLLSLFSLLWLWLVL